MKRSLIVGLTALVAGLLLAITAFGAPFRSYDRAAGDQYTTTQPPGCTNGNGGSQNPNCGTTSTPPACTNTNGNAPTNNPNCQAAPAPTSAVAGQGTTTPPAGEVEGESVGAAPEESKAGTVPSEDEGSGGVLPNKEAGANPVVGGANGAGTAAGAAARRNLAYLYVDDQSTELTTKLIAITGVPVWAAVVKELDLEALTALVRGTRFDGLGTAPLDLVKLRALARRLGADSVPATGLSGGIPDLVDEFTGAIEPITGLVLARTRLADADARRRAETFQRAFAVGAVKAGIPVIGVELNRTAPSSIAYFKTIKGASSVDDIGTKRGAISLTRLLSGAKVGHYGRRASAEAKVPPTIDADNASARLTDGGGSLGGSPLLVGILLTMALLGGRALVTVVQRSRPER